MLGVMQQILLEALLADDPPATLRRLLTAADGLTPEDRAALQRIEDDGLRLAALLIRKLRFERLTQALPELAALFAQAPAELAACFAEYSAATPPEGYFPDQEGRLYRQWQSEKPS